MSKKIEKFDISAKSTKTEIMDAYENLKAKLEEFSTRTTTDKKVEEIIKTEERKIVERASSYTVENIVKGLADLNLHMGKALTELSEKLTSEASKLDELRQAIDVESRQLEEIRDIRVAADTLALLIQEYETKKKTFEEETKEKEEAFARLVRQKKEEWDKEQASHDTMVKERNAALTKERDREREEYEYNLALTRKKDKDVYEQQKTALFRELEEKRILQEKEFTERESVISASESELAELRKKVETFQAALDKGIKEAEERATLATQQKADMAAKLIAKEIEGEKKVLELKIISLQEQVNKQTGQIESLTKQLADANNQVQAIAVKAIEGASGAKTLTTVQEIALEQAKQAKLQK